MPLPDILTDCYGNRFLKKDIKNKDLIDFASLKGLEDFSAEELASETVLVDDAPNGQKLYMLSDLKKQLKANNYVRVVDPTSKSDLVERIPQFHKLVLNFERNAANYNASVLEKYPHFVDLFKIYVEELLAPGDTHRYVDADIQKINANNSERLLREFYLKVAQFSDEEREAFNSLLINNREAVMGAVIEFPTKWDRNEQNAAEYDFYGGKNIYRPYPFRNVIIGGAFDNPMDACIHSWGVDVLYLLLEYHVGTNKPFQIFNPQENVNGHKIEKELLRRVKKKIPQGSLKPEQGLAARKVLKEFTENSFLPMSILKIKYYSFTQSAQGAAGTCYDGKKEFTQDLSERFYPDEYLIVDILEKYVQKSHPAKKDKILLVKEPWIGNTGSRSGSDNEKIAEQILALIDSVKDQNSDKLILAPFLLHYHHPGVAIDLKNRVVIYLDPFGSAPYEEVQPLLEALLLRNFDFRLVTAGQQVRGKDASSCGPILTDSMMTFIDDFLGKGCISETGFTAAKKELATRRFVQVNIRNPNLLVEESTATVDEISLADLSLWQSFFIEQNFNNPQLIDTVLKAVEKQKQFIGKIGSCEERHRKDLAFIIDFQARLTAAVLNKAQDQISALIQENDLYFDKTKKVKGANPEALVQTSIPASAKALASELATPNQDPMLASARADSPASPPPAKPQVQNSQAVNAGALKTIVSEIIGNIKGMKKSRHLPLSKSSKKIKLLEGLENFLKNRPDLKEKEFDLILALCESICELRRNPVGLFPPHSLEEFNLLVGDHKLKKSDMKVSRQALNSLYNISLTQIEENISKLLQDELPQDPVPSSQKL